MHTTYYNSNRLYKTGETNTALPNAVFANPVVYKPKSTWYIQRYVFLRPVHWNAVEFVFLYVNENTRGFAAIFPVICYKNGINAIILKTRWEKTYFAIKSAHTCTSYTLVNEQTTKIKNGQRPCYASILPALRRR